MEQIILNKNKDVVWGGSSMTEDGFLKPSYCGSIRTDLPLIVIGKKKRQFVKMMSTGQLFCVGKVYLKTHNGTIRIK